MTEYDWPEGDGYDGFYGKAFAGATTGRLNSSDEASEVYKGNVTELLKRLVDMKPGINLGRAYLVVPPDFKFPAMTLGEFEEEQTKSRIWRHTWGDYKFGIPVIRSHAMSIRGMAVDADWPVRDEPVLPRLMAEHVEPEQPQDLTAWQALIFVVGVGTILCLLGGVL